MRILQTVAGLWGSTGGPASSVPSLCRELGARGHRVTLVTGAGPLAEEVTAGGANFEIVTAPLGPYGLANFSLSFARACRQAAALAEIIHTHGVWLHPNWTSASAARRGGKPLVISPRGMLEPWALERSRWRKKALWLLLERRSFANASLIHATSDSEAASIRQLGVQTPIAVIPNGIDLEHRFSEENIRRAVGSARRPGNEPSTVLFLSRVHPKKGLDVLLEAWSGLEERPAERRLEICGGGKAVAVEALTRRLADLGRRDIAYAGPVSGDQKLARLAAASLLVLPSRSENYGMVIAEALASGTPVITTTKTPWQAIVERGCGWRIEIEAESLRHALEHALSLPTRELEEMGARGRALIEAEHSLQRTGEMMSAAYSWALGRRERPAWVEA